MEILKDIGNAEELLKDYYEKALHTLKTSKIESTRKYAECISKCNVIEKNRDMAIILVLGIMNTNRGISMDLKKRLKRKHANFRISRFFTLIRILCENYATEHENEEKFVRELYRAYNVCKDRKKKRMME